MKRTLAEFTNLTPAEKRLRDNVGLGEGVVFGADTLDDAKVPPEDAGPEVEITAEFLRYLCLGGCEGLRKPVPENGVRIAGARITGELDLEGAELKQDLVLMHCRIDDRANLRSARVRTVNFDGSTFPGFGADRLVASGSVFLRNGAKSTGEIRLFGAKLGGDLDCSDAVLTAAGTTINASGLRADGYVYLRGANVTCEVLMLGAKLGGDLDCVGATLTAEGNALHCDGLRTEGNVFLKGAEVTGEVRLLGATLGGDLSCIGATLTAESDALSCDRLRAEGNVFLGGAEVRGEVWLLGATLGGDLSCVGATLKSGASGAALDASRAQIGGTLYLRPDARQPARVDGRLILIGASIGDISDHPSCWPKRGDLILDRCRYSAFTGRAPVTAKTRIDWLDRQDPSTVGLDFWPQPWEQCAKVLREMGHAEDARQVLIAKEQRQRADRRRRLARDGRNGVRALLWIWDTLIGRFVRYGLQPLFAVVWLVGFWALGFLVYFTAYSHDAIKPNNAFVLRSPEWAACHPLYKPPNDSAALATRRLGTYPEETQLACFERQPEAASYPNLRSAIYSADTLLPIVHLEMQEFWIPDGADQAIGRFARSFLWFQIAMGWFLSLLAVAGLSGLIRSDR